MTYVCNGVCDSFKIKKIANGFKYESGQKRCSICCIFMNTSGSRCPCCSALLRTKSRNKKGNEQHHTCLEKINQILQ